MNTLQSLASDSFQTWLLQRSEVERNILGQLWALSDKDMVSVDKMAQAMLNTTRLEQLLERLPQSERKALEQVQRYGGQMAAPILEREYGRIRSHANYQNPRVYLLALEQPPEPTEALFLKGLLQEDRRPGWHVYRIPDDIFALLPHVPLRSTELTLPGEAAPKPPVELIEAEAWRLERLILEVLIAARRKRLPVLSTGALTKEGLKQLDIAWNKTKGSNKGSSAPSRESYWPYAQFIRILVVQAGLLRVDAEHLLRPTREVFPWLQLTSQKRLRQLLEAWIDSGWDDLRIFAGLKIGHEFRRKLSAEKHSLLRLVVQLPVDEWVSLDTLVAEIYKREPDFLRPDGEYSNWRISDRYGRPIDGFEYWDEVEGQFIRTVLTGSLYWLGLIDLSVHEDIPQHVRLTAFGKRVLQNSEPAQQIAPGPIIVQPNFEVIVPPEASLYAMFQLDRVAERTSSEEAQIFRLSRRSIHDALQAEIELEDIVGFLEQSSTQPLPQNVLASLQEWASTQRRLSIRRAAILSADSAALLEQLRHDKRIRLTGRALNEQEWELPESEAALLTERLRKNGYGIQNDAPELDAPLAERDLTNILAALLIVSRGTQSDIISAALLQRVKRLLPERQILRAYALAREHMGVGNEE